MSQYKAKLTLLILSLIFIMGVVPVLSVYAGPPPTYPRLQRAVADPQVMITGVSGDNYSFSLGWQRPLLSAIDDPRSVALIRDAHSHPTEWARHPEAYEIDFRNATTNEVWNTSQLQEIIDTGLSQELAPGEVPGVAGTANVRSVGPFNFTRSLNHSSLYEVRVVPVKMNPHRVWIPQSPGTPDFPGVGWHRAPEDPTPPIGPNVILMTDIQMFPGVGREGSVTIEWNNPTFNGANVFPYWEIAYANYAPGGIIGPQNARVVAVSELEQLPGGVLRHTIHDPRIRALDIINVRVEPMVGPNRPARPSTEINIGGERFLLVGSNTPEFTPDIPVLITPELRIETVGADFIRLFWSRLGGIGAINRVEVEEWPAGTTDEDVREHMGDANPQGVQTIGVIQGTMYVADINEWFIGPGIPRRERAFVLAIYLEGSDAPQRTNVVWFDPTMVNFSPYRPDIINLSARATAPGFGTLSDLQWLAFSRVPYIIEEAEMMNQSPHVDFGRFIDTSLRYEIFVSDTMETLVGLTEPLTIWRPGTEMPIPHQMRDFAPTHDPTWLYPGFLNEFDTRAGGTLERRLIEDNQVYYLRMRAVREPGGWASSWSYSAVFVPPYAGIPTRPEMISAPPVTLDRERMENQQTAALPIMWPTRYVEIQGDENVSARNNWHAAVGVDMGGRLIFGHSATQIEHMEGGQPGRYTVLNDLLPPAELANLLGHGTFPINLNRPETVGHFINNAVRPLVDGPEGFLTRLNANITTVSALRVQNMADFSFEIHVAEYNHMMSFGLSLDPSCAFTGYMGHINAAAMSGSWVSINPTVTEGVARFNVVSAHAPGGALRENTTYIVFIRPYRIFPGGTRMTALYPSFVIGSTPSEVDRPVATPTTPVLHPVPEFITDHSVGVRWRVQSDMGFELVIAERLGEYPDGGRFVDPCLMSQECIDTALADTDIMFEIRDVGGVPYYHLRIEGLFPATTYYVWARATALDSEGNAVGDSSQWSNPVDMRTLDIQPPPPPGLAPAGSAQLDLFNRLNNTQHSVNDPHALHLILTRILRDNTPREDAGTASGGTVNHLPLPTDTHNRMYLLRVEDLVTNTRYHVRARTVLTVTRQGDGIERQYAYQIEISDTEDFLDAITFEIPTIAAMGTANDMRRAYSEWVYIGTDTGRGDDEFDGAHRPDQFPLPEQDWEITYDPESQTLNWRFRTNQIGADGRPDQQVDQRFITRLIQNRTFTHTIDMSEFQGFPISNRVVELPLSILRAFDDRQITLEILTDEKSLQIPPGAFNTADTRNLQMGIGSNYRISLGAIDSNLPTLPPNSHYATIPQRLRVQAVTPDRTVTMNNFARPLDVAISMDDHTSPDGISTGLFFNGAEGGWTDISDRLVFDNNTLSGGIQAPGTFTAITREAPPLANPEDADHPSREAMQRVTSRMTITDMFQFDPSHEVTDQEFNNVILALSEGRRSVTLDRALTNQQTQSLRRANMLATPQNMNTETAMDILVRLYELRTRQPIRPMSTVGTVPGVENASASLQQNLLKAADIGFITGPLRPQAPLALGDLMNMVDIIMVDSGM